MHPGRLLFIHNPVAGAQRSDRQMDGARSMLNDLRRALAARHEWVESVSPKDATAIAANANDGRFSAVVAVGGDGTVHEVVEGLMLIPHATRPALGVLPIGSGNDFAFAAGIPSDLRAALDTILRGSTRSVDIGRVRDDLGRSAIFDNSLGIGFDAQVTIESMKYPRVRGFARYFAATLVTIARHHTPFEVEMEVDRLRLHERALMITVGNGPREGGGFMTTPGSVIDDGRFEMLLVKPISRPMMLALVQKVLRGTHVTSPSVYLRSFEQLRIRAQHPLTIHLDGEIFGDATQQVSQVDIELDPHALRVLV